MLFSSATSLSSHVHLAGVLLDFKSPVPMSELSPLISSHQRNVCYTHHRALNSFRVIKELAEDEALELGLKSPSFPTVPPDHCWKRLADATALRGHPGRSAPAGFHSEAHFFDNRRRRAQLPQLRHAWAPKTLLKVSNATLRKGLPQGGAFNCLFLAVSESTGDPQPLA
jgi:hypothetical protein